MFKQAAARHMVLIALLLVGLTWLHYVSPGIAHDRYHLEVIFQRLYFLPIVLGCLWFDLKGGLITFSAVLILLIPHHVMLWTGFTPDSLTRMMQLVVYLVIAVALGKTVGLQKREQLKAKQVESLAAIGKSLAAVAHDMKTPLIAIGGFANLIRKHLPPGNPDCGKVDIIISETVRLEAMIADMLHFSRPLELNLVQVDAQVLIKECLEIAAESAKIHKVGIEARLDNVIAPMTVDAMRMRQAIINLAINAIQASPEGEKVIVHGYFKQKNLYVDIIDCGCGIPLEMREAIFSPFFTTKKNGTGLGLPIVKKIIDAHGGFLDIIDNATKGLTFRMTIPCR